MKTKIAVATSFLAGAAVMFLVGRHLTTVRTAELLPTGPNGLQVAYTPQLDEYTIEFRSKFNLGDRLKTTRVSGESGEGVVESIEVTQQGQALFHVRLDNGQTITAESDTLKLDKKE